MHNKKFKKIEIIFFVAGIFLLFIIVASLIYLLQFLSQTLINSFSFGTEIAPPINFDIEGYNKLGL